LARLATALLAVAAIAAPLFGDRIEVALAEGPTHLARIAVLGGLLLLAAALAAAGRARLRECARARQAMRLLLFGLAGDLLLQGGTWGLLLWAEASMTLSLFWWFGMTGAFALLADARLWPAALGFLGAFAAAVAWQEHRHTALAAASAALVVNVAFAWPGWARDARPAG
jgi:hypothetical protein